MRWLKGDHWNWSAALVQVFGRRHDERRLAPSPIFRRKTFPSVVRGKRNNADAQTPEAAGTWINSSTS